MQVELSDSPLFEELKPLFERMYRTEKEKFADYSIEYASYFAALGRCRDYQAEQHTLPAPRAPYEGSEY